MTKEQETLKYLSAMRIIDYDKLGFVCAKETIDEVLNLIQQLQEENKQKDKMIDKITYSLADYVMYYEYDKCRQPDMIKDKAEEVKQYFQKKVSEE